MSIARDEDVFGLEVAVDDACCMQAFDALHNLSGVKTCPVSAQSSPSCKLGGKISSRMEILKIDMISMARPGKCTEETYHDQKQVFLVMETPPEFHHEGVL